MAGEHCTLQLSLLYLKVWECVNPLAFEGLLGFNLDVRSYSGFVMSAEYEQSVMT